MQNMQTTTNTYTGAMTGRHFCQNTNACLGSSICKWEQEWTSDCVSALKGWVWFRSWQLTVESSIHHSRLFRRWQCDAWWALFQPLKQKLFQLLFSLANSLMDLLHSAQIKMLHTTQASHSMNLTQSNKTSKATHAISQFPKCPWQSVGWGVSCFIKDCDVL